MRIVHTFHEPRLFNRLFNFQGIFYQKDRPNYLNYGGIGWVIGHEITHGFDDQGRQYDNVGNLQDWWDLETKNRFIGKTRCIIEQYGNYTASSVNLPLNGINTQGENIADNGGLKEAYRGYSKLFYPGSEIHLEKDNVL